MIGTIKAFKQATFTV